jgi:hypothetical protein
VCIGKVNAYGGIEQYVFGHIPYGGGTQLDHSWLPTRTDDTVATITPGRVFFRDGTSKTVSLVGGLNFGTHDKLWLNIDYTSTAPDATLVYGTAWPDFEVSEDQYNVPILEFVNNEWKGLVRRQTNDIIDFDRRDQIPDTSVEETTRKSIEKCPAEDGGKDAWQMRNFHLTATKEDQVPHVSFPSEGTRDIAWRWPVKGPDATTDDPGSLSSQVVTEIVNGVETSGNAIANIGVKSRSHTVEDGDEAWGADPESETNVQVGITWTGGTLYQVWQVMSGGYGWDWVRAH